MGVRIYNTVMGLIYGWLSSNANLSLARVCTASLVVFTCKVPICTVMLFTDYLCEFHFIKTRTFNHFNP
jgi:hypothetical protein